MSKLERQVAVKFRRKYAIKGNSIRVLKLPPVESYVYAECEKAALIDAIATSEQFYVKDGGESGVLIQLQGVHDYTWLPADCVERTS